MSGFKPDRVEEAGECLFPSFLSKPKYPQYIKYGIGSKILLEILLADVGCLLVSLDIHIDSDEE